jgi:hypothetical protein
MQQFVALLVLLMAASSLAGTTRIRRDEKYTTRYDNINVDEILESDRLRDNYISCVLETGKCTPEGTELRCEYWVLLNVTRIGIHLSGPNWFQICEGQGRLLQKFVSKLVLKIRFKSEKIKGVSFKNSIQNSFQI